MRPLKNLKILISKKFLLLLEILSNDATEEKFSQCVNNKDLVSWKTCNLNLILRYLAVAENLAIFVVCNWVLGLFNFFWVRKSKN